MAQPGDNANISDARMREALQGTMERMVLSMEALTDRIARLEAQNQAWERIPPPPPPHVENEDDYEDDGSDHWEDDQVTVLAAPRRRERHVGHGLDRGRGRGRGHHNFQRRAPREDAQVDRNLGNIKLKLPKFYGKTDPETYIQWEKEVEYVFACHNFSEEKKVRLCLAQFKDYAVTWWDKLMSSRRRNLEAPIDSWYEFKELLRKRFVPRHFQRDMAQKLQVLRQGSKSVEDYYKEMDTLMDRLDLEEDMENLMARFLNGLNKEITDKVDLQPYSNIEEMLHLAIKIEKQLQRRSQRYSTKPFSHSSSTWKKDSKSTDSKPRNREGYEKPKEKFEKGESSIKGKEKVDEPRVRNRDIKCWKCQGVGHYSRDCPNRRTMILREGELVTEDEKEEEVEEGENDEYESDEYSEEDPTHINLVTRRALNTQIKENGLDQDVLSKLMRIHLLINDMHPRRYYKAKDQANTCCVHITPSLAS